METAQVTIRETAEKRLTINYGGWYGGGIGTILMNAATASAKPDLPSVVAVCASEPRFESNPFWSYTDDELTKLCAFADVIDAKYHELFRVIRGCNHIIIDKPKWHPGKWMFKKATWDNGEWYDSIDDGIAKMTEYYCR